MKLNIHSVVYCLTIVSAFLITNLVSNSAFGQVTLVINGTYDTQGAAIFGETGSAVPYSYTLDYDPILDTNTQFFDVGDTLDGSTTIHQWHGYSVSGVVSSSFTFGTKTFSVADISTPAIEVGVAADFWFDTDIAVEDPTLFYFSITDFGSQPGLLNASDIERGGGIRINSFTRITDFTSSTSNNDTSASITVVPEPSSWFAMALASLIVAFRRQRVA